MIMNKIFNRLTAVALFFLALSCASDSFAQAYTGQIGIRSNRVEQKGDSLYIDFDICLSHFGIDKRQALVLTPILKADAAVKEFPQVVITGKNRNLTYTRSLVLASRQVSDPYATVVVKKEKTDTLRYIVSLPYQSWMEQASLTLKEDCWSCAGDNRLVAVSMLAGNIVVEEKPVEVVPDPEVILPYIVDPMLCYVTPAVEAVKARNKLGSAYLTFPVGKSTIVPDLGNNMAELDKVNNTITTARNDKMLEITGIRLVGYASPEGNCTANENLSKSRATALAGYIRERYDYPEAMYTIDWKGEDWAGLEALAREADITYKEQALAVITSTVAPDTREAKLKAVGGGTPYRYILKEIYPKLRRVTYEVAYNVRPFTLEESKEVLLSDPEKLSLNEMFIIARSYDKGSQQFNEVFDVAVRMFPGDAVANNNAAAAALERRDTQAGRKYLESAGRTREADNNLGVICLLEGDYAKARELLTRSAEAGCREALHNLEQLRLKEENIKRLEDSKAIHE